MIYPNPLWVGPLAFDPLQVLDIKRPASSTDTDSTERRLIKTATLDVNVSVIDGGFTEGDRTFRIAIDPVTADQVDIANRLLSLHPTIRLCKRDGVWICAPQAVQVNGGSMVFTIEAIREATNG